MIYTVSKKILLLLILFVSVGFSLADVNIDLNGEQIPNNVKDFSCKKKESACCNGKICSSINVSCVKGTNPVMKGCNEECMPIVVCQKIKANLEKTKEDIVRENLTKRFNIQTENKTKNEVLKEVKDVKVEKMNAVAIKLNLIISKLESMNYDSSKLKNYVITLNSIKTYLAKGNLTENGIKKYNLELKNIMDNVKIELSNVKEIYQ